MGHTCTPTPKQLGVGMQSPHSDHPIRTAMLLSPPLSFYTTQEAAQWVGKQIQREKELFSRNPPVTLTIQVRDLTFSLKLSLSSSSSSSSPRAQVTPLPPFNPDLSQRSQELAKRLQEALLPLIVPPSRIQDTVQSIDVCLRPGLLPEVGSPFSPSLSFSLDRYPEIGPKESAQYVRSLTPCDPHQ